MTTDIIDTFEFATAGRLVFGPGVRSQAGQAAAGFGSRALVVTGQSAKRAESLLSDLTALGVACERLAIPSEPTVDQIREGLKRAADHRADLIVALGGGSAIDAAKAIGLMATHAGDPLDYLEVVGGGRTFERAGLPLIALPTTAGTGSEVTRNAVLASTAHRLKGSLRSPWMLPRLALVDPELTFGLPQDVTARCGFDALSQLVEPYLSVRANPMTDALCREGLPRVARSLRRVATGSEDAAGRTDLAWAATLSGMALANAGLGIVHGLASVLGGLLSAPHGGLCARLLAPALRANLAALRRREADGRALRRMTDLGAWLAGDPRPEAMIAWIEALANDLRIPTLSAYGLTDAAIPQVAEAASRASSTRGNPVVLTVDEMGAILEDAI